METNCEVRSHLLHIFQMSSEDVQARVAHLLDDVDGVVVELGASGPDRFLIVECSSRTQALGIESFVTAVDPSAVIIQTSTCASVVAA